MFAATSPKQFGEDEYATLLAEVACLVDVQFTEDKANVLHVACWIGEVGVVESLLKKGADVDAPAGNMRSPLHIAAEKGHRAVVKVLL